MTTYQLSCIIGTTDPTAELGLEIWTDNNQLFNSDHITQESLPLTFGLEEDELEHELRFVMKGKTSNHTAIGDNSNIIKDACLSITNVAFDEIMLNQVLIDNATYTHDFNGTQDKTTEKFYGVMGCNGTVSLKYSTPIYLWLLEHL